MLLGLCGVITDESAVEECLRLFDLASLMVVLCDSGGKVRGSGFETRHKDVKNVGLVGGTQGRPRSSCDGERATSPRKALDSKV